MADDDENGKASKRRSSDTVAKSSESSKDDDDDDRVGPAANLQCAIISETRRTSTTICVEKPRPKKQEVYVQVVFMKIGEIDTMKETFAADVFVHARWREPKLDGSVNAKEMDPEKVNWNTYWNPKLYVDNTVGEPRETISHTIMYDTASWEAFIVERRRVKGTFLENLELFSFPFDTQDITITLVSERTEDELTLQDDPKQLSTINVESFVDEQEWRLYNEVVTFRGSVNKFYEGDSAECLGHPSISCRTHARRRCGYYIFRVMVTMILLTILSMTTFSVDMQKYASTRLVLTFFLALSVVVFKNAISAQLPRISYLTTLDIYMLASWTILTLTCIWHAVLPTVLRNHGLEAAERGDAAVVITVGILHVLLHLTVILFVGIKAVHKHKFHRTAELKHMKRLKKDRKRRNTHCSGNLQDIRRASLVAIGT